MHDNAANRAEKAPAPGSNAKAASSSPPEAPGVLEAEELDLGVGTEELS